MFDLYTGKITHIPGGGTVSVVLSSAFHVFVLSAIVILPLLYVSNVLPEVPSMMAFVAAPPPPPPPPPPPMPKAQADKAAAKPAAVELPNPAPVEAPLGIQPELTTASARDEGQPGGVEGGVAGGVAMGVVEGLPAAPPPPPPPPVPRGPVRIGGQVQAPTLIRRVEPTYPELAIRAHAEGTVILEAIVSEDGDVQSVKVLRSLPLLDKAAIAAVQQWRYSPVLLNGTPVPFVLTVVLTFSLPQTRGAARS